MDSKNYTQVLIDGKIYTLGGSEDEGYLQKAASYVNEKVNSLRRIPGFSKQSVEYQTVMAELNMADDYFKALEHGQEVERRRDELERETYSLKHELVSTQMKLEVVLKDLEERQRELEELTREKHRLERKLRESAKNRGRLEAAATAPEVHEDGGVKNVSGRESGHAPAAKTGGRGDEDDEAGAGHGGRGAEIEDGVDGGRPEAAVEVDGGKSESVAEAGSGETRAVEEPDDVDEGAVETPDEGIKQAAEEPDNGNAEVLDGGMTQAASTATADKEVTGTKQETEGLEPSVKLAEVCDPDSGQDPQAGEAPETAGDAVRESQAELARKALKAAKAARRRKKH